MEFEFVIFDGHDGRSCVTWVNAIMAAAAGVAVAL
jgi:hypothetical protein